MNRAVRERGAAILRRLPTGRQVYAAEVGVMSGKLSRFLLSRRADLTLYMVDNFLSGDRQSPRYKNTRDNNAFLTEEKALAHQTTCEKIRNAYRERCCLLVGDSVEQAEKLREAGMLFDMVFLDADHSEEGVLNDILAWDPMVKEGGYIGGHDYGNTDDRFDFSGVERAVLTAFPKETVELGPNFTWFVKK